MTSALSAQECCRCLFGRKTASPCERCNSRPSRTVRTDSGATPISLVPAASERSGARLKRLPSVDCYQGRHEAQSTHNPCRDQSSKQVVASRQSRNLVRAEIACRLDSSAQPELVPSALCRAWQVQLHSVRQREPAATLGATGSQCQGFEQCGLAFTSRQSNNDHSKRHAPDVAS